MRSASQAPACALDSERFAACVTHSWAWAWPCTGGNQSVIYGNDVEGTLLEIDSAVKDNPWAPMRISLHGKFRLRPTSPRRVTRPCARIAVSL